MNAKDEYERLSRIARAAVIAVGRDPDERINFGIKGSGAWHIGTRTDALAGGVLETMTLHELVAIIDAVLQNPS